MSNMSAETFSTCKLLDVRGLRVSFDAVDVLHGVDLTVHCGRIHALIGESGSGKSVLARSILGLAGRGARTTGSIRFLGRELVGLSEREYRAIRGADIGLVVQDAMSALNPMRTIGEQLVETIACRHPDFRSGASRASRSSRADRHDIAPVLAPYDLEAMDLTARLLMPFESAAHILGTDELGRDIFSRLLYSIRMSFVLAVVGTLLGAVIGTLLGFLAARFGGIVDDAVNCGIDFTASLPFIILALTIIAFLGTDVTVIIVIMAVYGWDRYARLTRNLSRSAYTEGYACALEGLGLPTVSIALRHILPNIASALVVNMTLNFPGMILLETSLSFLGVGVQPPMSSLGTMLGFGRDYLTTAWWIAVIPGLVIVVSTLSMSILGDWVQQKLEPAAR